jgi:hypothetical protein
LSFLFTTGASQLWAFAAQGFIYWLFVLPQRDGMEQKTPPATGAGGV